MQRLICSLFASLLFSFPALAQDHSPFPGPIELGNQYPLALMQPSMRPKRAQIESVGNNKYSFTSAWSSTSISEDSYVVDDETVVMEAAFHHGFAEDWQFGFVLPVRTEGGGTLDSFINGWHRAFGLPDGDRPDMPYNDHNISGQDNDGSFDFGKSGFGVGTPELSLDYCLASKTCAGITIGLPAPSVDYGQQAAAVGADFVTSIDLEQFSWSGGGSLWYYGDTSIDDVDYRSLVPNAFVVVEYLYDSVWQFYTSFWGGLQNTKGIEGHPNSQWYLDVGSSIRVGSGMSLDVMLRENPYPGHGTTDLSMVLGFTLRR